MKEKIKLIFDKFIIIFLLLQPFVDAFTMLQIRYEVNNITASMIFRFIFFMIMLLYIIKNKKLRKYGIIFSVYFIFQIIFMSLYMKNSISMEISNIFQIFYLPLAILFFNKYENKKINDRLILILNFIYISMIIVPYLFHFGVYASDLYKEKSGFYGLFYGGNEISMILLALFPISVKALCNIKNILIKIIYIVSLALATLLIATKTLLFGIIIVFIYYAIKYLKANIKLMNKGKKMLIISSILAILLVMIILIPKTAMYSNIKLAMKTFRVSDKNLFSIYSLDKIVFSGRLGFLKNINNIYMNSGLLSMLFGLGKTLIVNVKIIEIDIFDLFYSVGIIGFLIYVLYMVRSMKQIRLKNVYKFDFIFLLIISLVVGHILLAVNVSIFLALLAILNKNNEME